MIERADKESRPQRIQRFRDALREWQEATALAAAVSLHSYQYHGRVWLYERIAPEDPPP